MSQPNCNAPARTPGPTPTINPRHTCFQLTIRPSVIHRWGVYTDEFIPRGRKVMEYTGERCSRRETRVRSERPINYMFTLDNYWALDGSVGGSGAEFINHSCDPNIRAWICRGHILYMAKRDIQPGEELTVDYHFDPDVEMVPCRCGAVSCRGTINHLPLSRRRKSA